jgi:hypothetical protein
MLLMLKMRLQTESVRSARSFIIACIGGLLADELIAMLLLEGFQ